jgi:hypothetical protein
MLTLTFLLPTNTHDARYPYMRCTNGGGPTNDSVGTCFVTASGSCVSNGPRPYGNNERCTVQVLQDGWLSVAKLDVESYYDYLSYSGSGLRLDR